MDRRKRNKQINKPKEAVVNNVMDRIPQALLQLQDRGFLAPKRESLEVDALFESLVKEEEEARETGGSVYNNQQYLNVFERHEQRLANALPGLIKNTVKKDSSTLTQEYAFTLNDGNNTRDNTTAGMGSNQGTRPLSFQSELQGPQKILSILSENDGKALGNQSTLDFQVPDFHRASVNTAPKIEIGKLIEQVNIHAQDISGGSQQLVKVLKEKLVDILKNELKTT